MPDHLAKKPDTVPCPVLLFSNFTDVIFKKPVTISARIPDLTQPAVRLSRLDDIRNSPFLWDDVTDTINKTINGDVVEIQVQQFCGYEI